MNSVLRAVLAALIVATPRTAPARQVDARAVVDQVDRLLRGESSRASVSMQITTRQWSRSLDMTIWSKGNDYELNIETKDGSLVDKILVSKQTGWMRSAY